MKQECSHQNLVRSLLNPAAPLDGDHGPTKGLLSSQWTTEGFGVIYASTHLSFLLVVVLCGGILCRVCGIGLSSLQHSRREIIRKDRLVHGEGATAVSRHDCARSCSPQPQVRSR